VTYRIVVTYSLFSCILLALTASAQPGDRHLDLKARVLDEVFSSKVSQPYFRKMVLRFGDSDTQIVVVTYPGGKSELIRYSLSGMSGGKLSPLIAKMVAQNPDVKAKDIAAKLQVDVKRSVIEQGALTRAIDELKTICISPVLASRVAVDDSSEYEFWYDTWQESVHYTITGPFHDDPQDTLGRWMLKFRANVPELLKASLRPRS
jgi:hypothetical protein